MAKSADSQKKILLADDSVTMHRAVSLALKNDGYELICCDNGKDALRLMYEHRPAVALLDLDMPEKTGIEVAQDAKSDPNLSGTQLVLLCGSFDEVDENEVEKAPVDGRLWKPFESHVLLTLLSTLLDSRNQAHNMGSTDIQAPSAQEAFETTNEVPAPKLDSPKEEIFEAPKSHKVEVLEKEESRISKSVEHNPAQSEQLQSSVEETRAMSVDELFKPQNNDSPTGEQPIFAEEQSFAAPDDATRPINRNDINSEKEELPSSEIQLPSDDQTEDNSDFSRSLTKETFHNLNEDSAELPPPEQNNFNTEIKLSEETTVPPVPPAQEDPLAQNLWSAEEMSPLNEQSQFTEETESPTGIHNDFETEENTDVGEIDFEILNQSKPELQTHPSENNADWLGEQHRKIATPELEEVVKRSQYEASERVKAEQAAHNIPQDSHAGQDLSPGLDQESVRTLVQAEVQRVFNSWLKDELKRQLDQVMAELDNDF